MQSLNQQEWEAIRLDRIRQCVRAHERIQRLIKIDEKIKQIFAEEFGK